MISPTTLSLMREQSHAEVYLVYGGMKLWITSPQEMYALGLDWSKVQVVPDGTLDPLPGVALGPFGIRAASDFMFGDLISSPQDYDVGYYYNVKVASAIVARNILVAGWLVKGAERNRSTALLDHRTEDYHFDLFPDVDFLAAMYGNGGLSTALSGAVLHGNTFGPWSPYPMQELPFQDISVKQTPLGVTMNSFFLPNSDVSAFKVELNTWHINREGIGVGPHSYYAGRGTPPSGWVGDPGPNPLLPPDWEHDNNEAYPWNPHNPDGGPHDLNLDDYVIIRGTLWQDNAHEDKPGQTQCWSQGTTLGHGGWLEIHPVDWIHRLPISPPSDLRKSIGLASVCTSDTKPVTFNFYSPFPKLASAVLTVKGTPAEFIDGRFSKLSTITNQGPQVTPICDHLEVVVSPNLPGGGQCRFKAVYVITWQAGNEFQVQVEPYPVPQKKPVRVIVHVTDSLTGNPVAGQVLIEGKQAGTTNTPFTYTFICRNVGGEPICPTGIAHLDFGSACYLDVALDFGL